MRSRYVPILLALALPACGFDDWGQSHDCYDVGGCEGAVAFDVVARPNPVTVGDTMTLRIALADSLAPAARSYEYYWFELVHHPPRAERGRFIVPRSDGRGDISTGSVGPGSTSAKNRAVRWVPYPFARPDTVELQACVDIDGGQPYYTGTCQNFRVSAVPRPDP